MPGLIPPWKELRTSEQTLYLEWGLYLLWGWGRLWGGVGCTYCGGGGDCGVEWAVPTVGVGETVGWSGLYLLWGLYLLGEGGGEVGCTCCGGWGSLLYASPSYCRVGYSVKKKLQSMDTYKVSVCVWVCVCVYWRICLIPCRIEPAR